MDGSFVIKVFLRCQMNVEIRPCQISEAALLRDIGEETYETTFREMATPEAMAAYLKEAFTLEKIAAELANPDSRFFFLLADGDLAGYLKVNDGPAQTELHDREALEIERIYVRAGHQGKGLGAKLINFALYLAREMGKRYVWLGVWQKNTAAIGFYKKMGFEIAGTHVFRMGDDIQSDYIMRKDL